MSEELYDITIIGAGPAGLFTAFYGGMRQAKVKIIESLPQTGGQLAALYPEKYIYDVAGFPKIKAVDLVKNLEKQVEFFNPTIILDEAIEKVEKQEDGSFKLIGENGQVHLSKTIIITAGNGAFTPRRLNIDNSEDFEGINLHYHVTDLKQFTDKNVVLLGGGDSAVDWALMLKDIAKSVTLVHRRDQFRAHESSVEQLKNSTVELITPYAAESITTSDKIDSITLQEVRGENKITLEVDDIICNYGFISSLGPIKDWGIKIEKNSIVVNSKMETNIPGIYAAGDVTTYDGKVKLIVTGFGEGPTAVNNAMRYMNPKARVQPRHSTDMEMF
ncbi:NAD(P)/FAD-dependent oxidoreductase [Oceanobacillus luteolus]|uniref:Ferredoxin--NADP reductase n=1 Tax=Oceanobacillus luteolus TaxID=1274358 RepID=A0ABW4HT03_9BACI|nr:NAD(P)/FAD-dependent oxidoreductase [Oceanobacillus luteolus]MCM3739356.1 NAD(P)/FAD-dependent oxidoreductase [Oceanobacillus luteolus]